MKDCFRFFIIRFLKLFFFPEVKTNIGSPQEVLVDDPDEMFQLADLLQGVSVDCSEFSSESRSPGMNNLIDTGYHVNNIVFVPISKKLNCLYSQTPIKSSGLQKTKHVPQTVMKISGNYVTRICYNRLVV